MMLIESKVYGALFEITGLKIVIRPMMVDDKVVLTSNKDYAKNPLKYLGDKLNILDLNTGEISGNLPLSEVTLAYCSKKGQERLLKEMSR